MTGDEQEWLVTFIYCYCLQCTHQTPSHGHHNKLGNSRIAHGHQCIARTSETLHSMTKQRIRNIPICSIILHWRELWATIEFVYFYSLQWNVSMWLRDHSALISRWSLTTRVQVPRSSAMNSRMLLFLIFQLTMVGSNLFRCFQYKCCNSKMVVNTAQIVDP